MVIQIQHFRGMTQTTMHNIMLIFRRAHTQPYSCLHFAYTAHFELLNTEKATKISN